MHPKGAPPSRGEAEEGGGAAEVSYGAVAPGCDCTVVRGGGGGGGGGGGDGEGCIGEDDGTVPAAEVPNGEKGEDWKGGCESESRGQP